MNFNKNIRYHLFWLLDYLKGGILKKELNNVTSILSINSFSVLQKRNAPVLKHLLDTAVKSSKFYESYKEYDSLTDFPVINKLIIKDHFESINIVPNNSKEVIKASSSGSTGIPFTIFWTKAKARRNKADVIFFARSAGYTIGDQLFFVRLWTKKYNRKYLAKKILNLVQVDVESLSDNRYSEKLLSTLKSKNQPKGIIGYPSGFEKICNYLDEKQEKPLECKMKSIIASAETLYDNVRDKMEYYFKTPVVSRYSNEENGIISQQMVHDKHFTINWASYFVEILNLNEDIPAKPGELGRIVITDLYNLATPMIRYDTGDLGEFSNYEKDKIPKFETIVGRKKDALYNTQGNLVSPFIIHANLYNYPELVQFQIVQKTKKEYIFKINCKSKFQREEEFVTLFKSYLGIDAIISIEYIEEIPLLSSGKRRTIINLYKP